MTKTRAERLTGCEVRRLQEADADGRVVYGAFHGDELIAEAANLNDDYALQILVRQIYAIHSLEFSSGTTGGVPGAGASSGCKFTTGSSVPMVGRTGSRTWSPCAGTATS